jgi:four helix bundle protein
LCRGIIAAHDPSFCDRIACRSCRVSTSMGNFRTLVAWQKAMDLVDAVYAAAATFPRTELFELSSQIKAAATSTPSLLAEGNGRYTKADQRHFYRQARGSNYEVQTQIEIARRQHFISDEHAIAMTKLAEEVGRLINGLLRRVAA